MVNLMLPLFCGDTTNASVIEVKKQHNTTNSTSSVIMVACRSYVLQRHKKCSLVAVDSPIYQFFASEVIPFSLLLELLGIKILQELVPLLSLFL